MAGFGDVKYADRINMVRFGPTLKARAIPPREVDGKTVYGVGACARHVRMALEDAGFSTHDRPVFAKDYGPFLERLGFKKIATIEIEAQPGDIVVIQPYLGGNPAGHIAGHDGRAWISDFEQNDMWGGGGYRKAKPPFAIYRYYR